MISFGEIKVKEVMNADGTQIIHDSGGHIHSLLKALTLICGLEIGIQQISYIHSIFVQFY